MSTYKTLHEFGMDEIIIEKSTFIGYAKPIKTEEEAIEFVNEIKKKHKDATHNVWAYTVGENYEYTEIAMMVNHKEQQEFQL